MGVEKQVSDLLTERCATRLPYGHDITPVRLELPSQTSHEGGLARTFDPFEADVADAHSSLDRRDPRIHVMASPASFSAR
jgi:hypothetical protein